MIPAAPRENTTARQGTDLTAGQNFHSQRKKTLPGSDVDLRPDSVLFYMLQEILSLHGRQTQDGSSESLEGSSFFAIAFFSQSLPSTKRLTIKEDT